MFLTVLQLCLLWWLYRTRHVQLRDYRVWHACHEMVARRCQLTPNQDPVYTLTELHTLVGGVGGAHLRASLRRLEALGLLTWSRTQITFATSVEALHGVAEFTDFYTMLAEVAQSPQRRVPVPRQTLRLIAGGCATAMIATMLGHMLRCLYYQTRPHHCVSGGWCKHSWIAKVFRVNLRNVKAARRHLAILGWLQILPVPQYTRNRWGSYVQVSLTWNRAAHDAQASLITVHKPALPPLLAPVVIPTESPPLLEFSTTQEPPLPKHDEPLRDRKHQEPAQQADPTPLPQQLQQPMEPASGGLLTGVYIQGNEQRSMKQPIRHAPTLHHMVPEDLQDTARLLTLFEQAHREGLIGKSDGERLAFLSLAEHARGIGTVNPCGLFAALVRRQCWHYITDRDEDAASARLKQYWYGREGPRSTVAPPRPAALSPLSKDAFMVRELHRELARAGFQGEVFGWVHRAYPEWTRARWDAAVTELTAAQQGWQRANAGTCLEACAQALDTTWAA